MQMFFILWFGLAVSGLGTGLGSFALGVWVYQKTGSATQFAMMALTGTITGLLLAPISGTLVDRWNRRRLILAGNTGSMLMILTVAFLLFKGLLQPWHIFPFIVVMTTLGSLSGPAVTASVPLLVPRDQLARAIGLAQMVGSTIGIVSPLLSGMLMGKIGVSGILFIDVVTFSAAITSVLLVKIPRAPASAEGSQRRSFLSDALYGWHYLRHRAGLMSLLALFAMTNFSVGIVQVLLTPLILSFATPTELGTVNSAGAAGLLVGSVVFSAWGGPRRKVWALFGCLILQALILFLGGLQPSVPLITAAVFAFMLTGPIVSGSNQTIWQSKVPLDLQGRVFAMRGIIGSAAAPLAFALAGPLADRVFEPMLMPGGTLAGSVGRLIGVGPGRGVGFLIMTVGAVVILVTVLSFLNPRLRRVETELPDAEQPDFARTAAGPAETVPETAAV
jgi:MFS family permease